MHLTLRQLHNLPVETRSGRKLGRVVDVELDPDRQEVAAYHVRSRTVIPGLLEQKLLIDRRQVIQLTTEKLVVEDAVIGFENAPVAAPDAPPPA